MRRPSRNGNECKTTSSGLRETRRALIAVSPAACLAALLCLPLGAGILSRDQGAQRVAPVLRTPPRSSHGPGHTWFLLAPPLPGGLRRALREGGLRGGEGGGDSDKGGEPGGGNRRASHSY